MSEPLIVEPGAHRPRGVPPRGLMAIGLGAFTLAGMLWYLWSEDTAPPPDSSAQMHERLRVAAQSAARGSPAARTSSRATPLSIATADESTPDPT